MVLSECDGAGAGHALCIAVEAKRIELVELCAGKSGSSYKSKALEQAAQGEQIAVLDALMNYLDETSVWRALEQLPSDTNVVVLEAIVKNRDPEIYPNNFAAAAERGLLGLVNCLQGGMDANSIRWALLLAAANDHAEVVSALLRDSDLESIGCALEAAATEGHSNVLLSGHCDLPSACAAWASAEKAGHVDVVRLLDEALGSRSWKS